MKIIDAHFHLFEPPVSQEDGQAQTTRRPEADRLLSCWGGLDIVSGVIMGNRSLEPDYHCYPAPMRYCIGLDSHVLLEQLGPDQAARLVEENLRRPSVWASSSIPATITSISPIPCTRPFTSWPGPIISRWLSTWGRPPGPRASSSTAIPSP